jgi:hypothetical protein
MNPADIQPLFPDPGAVPAARPCGLPLDEGTPPLRTLLLPRVQRNRQFRLWPRRVYLLASAPPMRLGMAWSWLWWLFVFVLPDGSR